MKPAKQIRYRCMWAAVAGAAVTLAANAASAQDSNNSWWNSNSIGSNYRVNQSGNQLPPSDPSQPLDVSTQNAVSSGPVRMARFVRAEGNVTWRPLAGGSWSQATVNLPLRQGAQIWVTDGGRADLQFDDGTELRIGNGGLVTLKTMYSDSQGEYTRITLRNGLATLRLLHSNSIYQIDTPIVSVTANGQTRVRIGVGDGVEVAVQAGSAQVQGEQGTITMQNGQYMGLNDGSSPFDPQAMPQEDSWDRWNDRLDANMYGSPTYSGSDHLPANIAVAAGNLSQYGNWVDTPSYGWVWQPEVSQPDWRPYSDGRWVYVNPFGWTWVDNAPWGWAPYHYGTWTDLSSGWAWVPGPSYQPWCPAVVNFSTYDGDVAWAALAPREVHYTRTSFGFGIGSNWFSISQVAAYLPVNRDSCDAVPFSNNYVNNVTYVNNTTYNNFGGGGNSFTGHPTAFDRFNASAEGYAAATGRNVRFIPVNALRSGGMVVRSAQFGSAQSYQPLSRTRANVFATGVSTGTSSRGVIHVFGPATVAPRPAIPMNGGHFNAPARVQPPVFRGIPPRGSAFAGGHLPNRFINNARNAPFSSNVPAYVMRARQQLNIPVHGQSSRSSFNRLFSPAPRQAGPTIQHSRSPFWQPIFGNRSRGANAHNITPRYNPPVRSAPRYNPPAPRYNPPAPRYNPPVRSAPQKGGGGNSRSRGHRR